MDSEWIPGANYASQRLANHNDDYVFDFDYGFVNPSKEKKDDEDQEYSIKNRIT